MSQYKAPSLTKSSYLTRHITWEKREINFTVKLYWHSQRTRQLVCRAENFPDEISHFNRSFLTSLNAILIHQQIFGFGILSKIKLIRNIYRKFCLALLYFMNFQNQRKLGKI